MLRGMNESLFRLLNERLEKRAVEGSREATFEIVCECAREECTRPDPDPDRRVRGSSIGADEVRRRRRALGRFDRAGRGFRRRLRDRRKAGRGCHRRGGRESSRRLRPGRCAGRRASPSRAGSSRSAQSRASSASRRARSARGSAGTASSFPSGGGGGSASTTRSRWRRCGACSPRCAAGRVRAPLTTWR